MKFHRALVCVENFFKFDPCKCRQFLWHFTEILEGIPFLAVPCSLQDLKFPKQGSNPCPLQWKHRVLTTGPPGKSLWGIFILTIIVFVFPGGSVGKESTRNSETWVRSLGWEDPLEEGMATHSNILAWRIPWTEEPGVLQSVGLQRVRHAWVTKHTAQNKHL